MATISIIHEDETENEFEIDICCEDCAKSDYGWNKEQYDLFCSRVHHTQPFRVPDSIQSDKQLIAYVQTLCKGLSLSIKGP